MAMVIASTMRDLKGKQKKALVLKILEGTLKKYDLPGPDWVSRKVVMFLAPTLIEKFIELTRGDERY
jgi:hypothetical protein